MATTILTPSETRTFPSWNGPAPMTVTVSIHTGEDPSSVRIACDGVFPVPVERAVTVEEPVSLRVQFFGCLYTVTNTGPALLSVVTTLEPLVS